MLIHPQIDPVALQLGPIAVHWYGLTYLAAFGLFYFLATRRLTHLPYARLSHWQVRDVEDILFAGVLGVVLLGVMAAMVWFAKTRHRPFFQVMDFVAPCVPTGLAAGRIGNFINGELWGRQADPELPWGMIFRGAGDFPRHPSQLYQFLLEGLLLFLVLWFFARKDRPTGQVSAVFLMGYGIFRFVAEFFREPDSHLGLLSLGLSMGQWLCVPMILAGVFLYVAVNKPSRL